MNGNRSALPAAIGIGIGVRNRSRDQLLNTSNTVCDYDYDFDSDTDPDALGILHKRSPAHICRFALASIGIRCDNCPGARNSEREK